MKKVFSVVTAIAIAISIVPTSFAAARSNVIITTDGPAAGDVEIDAQDVELLSLHIDANVDVEFRNFPIKIRSTELAGSPAQGLLNGVESNYTDIKVVDANSGNVVFGPIDSSELKTVIGGANRITDRGGDQIGYFPFDDGFVVQSGKPADLIVTADVANNAELVGSTLNAYMQNNSQYPEIRKLSNNALATLNPRAVIAGKDMKIVGRQEDFNHPIITLAADTPSGFRAPSFAETILKFNVTAPEEAIQVEKVVVNLTSNSFNTNPLEPVECGLVKRGGFSQVIAYSNVSFLENNHAVVTFNLDEDAARFNLDEGLSIVSGDQTVAFGLECNTQALLLHSPADEALLTTINFGSFDQGVLVSGDFHWSYDSSPDQVIEWVNREEGALQGLPLIY